MATALIPQNFVPSLVMTTEYVWRYAGTLGDGERW